jgi:hypothetical protein
MLWWLLACMDLCVFLLLPLPPLLLCWHQVHRPLRG